MAKLGYFNTLQVLRETQSGLFLDGENLGDILLPGRYIPKGIQSGDNVEVFVYLDSEDRLVATTEEPYCIVGDFAYLEVVASNKTGAFLNWGLQKDLLVPFSEQKTDMNLGTWHIVHVYVDEKSNRIVASAKINRFLNLTAAPFATGEQVELFITGSTPLGYTAIINQTHTGILYKNEVFQPLQTGEWIAGFVSKIREDGKIDLSIYPPGHAKATDSADLIIKYLEAHDGYMKITDKSEAPLIYETFGISKKNFKMAIGNLYKQKLIFLETEGIRLSKQP